MLYRKHIMPVRPGRACSGDRSWDCGCKNGQGTRARHGFRRTTRREKFFEEQLRQAGRVVADDPVFFQKIVENDAIAEFLRSLRFDGNWFGTLGAVALGDFRRNRLAIGDHPIDHAAGVWWRMARR